MLARAAFVVSGLAFGCGPGPEQAVMPAADDGTTTSDESTGAGPATSGSPGDTSGISVGGQDSTGAVASATTTGPPPTPMTSSTDGGESTGEEGTTTGPPPPPMVDPMGPYGDCGNGCPPGSVCQYIKGQPGSVCAPGCAAGIAACPDAAPGVPLRCEPAYGCFIQCGTGCPVGMMCNIVSHCVWP